MQYHRRIGLGPPHLLMSARIRHEGHHPVRVGELEVLDDAGDGHGLLVVEEHRERVVRAGAGGPERQRRRGDNW